MKYIMKFSWSTLCWYVSPRFFIHFWHISMTTEPMSVTWLHVTLGNKFWSWSLGSFLEKKMVVCVGARVQVLYSAFWCFVVVCLCYGCTLYYHSKYLSLDPNFLWSLWAASSTTDSNTVANAGILLYWSPGPISKHSICSVSNCDRIHGKMSLEN